jgi:hypothetical protein
LEIEVCTAASLSPSQVPTFGRSLRYDGASCELLVGCAGDEVYRLDLAEGRFKAPLPLPTKGFGVNQLEVVGSGLFVQGQGARREEHPMWVLLLFSRGSCRTAV